jgi:hypothetical protein
VIPLSISDSMSYQLTFTCVPALKCIPCTSTSFGPYPLCIATATAPSCETFPTQYSMMRIYFTAPWASFRAFYSLEHIGSERMGMRSKRQG